MEHIGDRAAPGPGRRIPGEDETWPRRPACSAWPPGCGPACTAARKRSPSGDGAYEHAHRAGPRRGRRDAAPPSPPAPSGTCTSAPRRWCSSRWRWPARPTRRWPPWSATTRKRRSCSSCPSRATATSGSPSPPSSPPSSCPTSRATSPPRSRPAGRGHDARTRYADAPSSWCRTRPGSPSPACSAAPPGSAGPRGRTRSRRPCPLLGRWLTFFAERAEHPASSLMLAVTDALAVHWATGQSPLEDRNLGALLGWIDPPPGMSGPQAAARGRGPGALPAGRAGHRPHVRQRGARRADRSPSARAKATGDGRAMDRARGRAAPTRSPPSSQPTWALMWRAVALLRAPAARRPRPEPGGTPTRTRSPGTRSTLRDGGPPQPRRDGAVSAARRLASLERRPGRWSPRSAPSTTRWSWPSTG